MQLFQLELTAAQIRHVAMLVNADLKLRVDDQRHAAAYGGAHVDVTISDCQLIIDSLSSAEPMAE